MRSCAPASNGLFYYSGLVFDRDENGKSGIFVARFIDNNNKEAGDPIAYLGTSLVAHVQRAPGGPLPRQAMDGGGHAARGSGKRHNARSRSAANRRKERQGIDSRRRRGSGIGRDLRAYHAITGDGDALRSEIYVHVSD